MRGDAELRDSRDVSEREDKHRQDEQDGFEDTQRTMVAGLHKGCEIPLRNEVQGDCAQGKDERVDHEVRRGEHHLVAKGERCRHQSYAQRREDPPGDLRPVELVNDEAFHRVRNGGAVDEHHGEDGEPVDGREQDAFIAPEELGEDDKHVRAGNG